MPQPRQTTCKQYFLPSARGSHEGSFLTANGFLPHNTFINLGQATCPPSRIQRLLICACSQLRLAVLGTDHKLVLLSILEPRAHPNQWGSASNSDFVITLSANGNTGLNPWVEKTHSSPPYRGWVVGKLERLVVKKPIFDQVP